MRAGGGKGRGAWGGRAGTPTQLVTYNFSARQLMIQQWPKCFSIN
jgi:hypothetical protein